MAAVDRSTPGNAPSSSSAFLIAGAIVAAVMLLTIYVSESSIWLALCVVLVVGAATAVAASPSVDEAKMKDMLDESALEPASDPSSAITSLTASGGAAGAAHRSEGRTAEEPAAPVVTEMPSSDSSSDKFASVAGGIGNNEGKATTQQHGPPDAARAAAVPASGALASGEAAPPAAATAQMPLGSTSGGKFAWALDAISKAAALDSNAPPKADVRFQFYLPWCALHTISTANFGSE